MGARRANGTASASPSEAPRLRREEIYGILPDDVKKQFDMREIIARIVDGSRFHEYQPNYGSTLVCGFANIWGFKVGMLANNGVLFNDSSLKGGHFIELCNQNNTPLVFLQNITGYMVGREYERRGITKDGAKMIMAQSCSRVPKFTVMCNGSFGAGNYGMCGRAFDARLLFAWPNHQIGVMGGDQAANTLAEVKLNQMKRNGEAIDQTEIDRVWDETRRAYQEQLSAYYSTSRAVGRRHHRSRRHAQRARHRDFGLAERAARRVRLWSVQVLRFHHPQPLPVKGGEGSAFPSPSFAGRGRGGEVVTSGRNSMVAYADISFRQDGAVARITVERPDKLNAYRDQTADELFDAFQRAERDASVRAVILSGAGRAFGAGYDLSVIKPDETPELDRVLEVHFNPLIRLMRASRLPIVSQVNGPCAGAAVGVALAGDIVIAARSAYFYEPFVGIALVPDAGNTLFMPRLAGRVRAAPAMLLGDRVSAEEALNWGLVWRVFDDAALAREADAIARRLAERAPAAIAATKRLIAAVSRRRARGTSRPRARPAGRRRPFRRNEGRDRGVFRQAFREMSGA